MASRVWPAERLTWLIAAVTVAVFTVAGSLAFRLPVSLTAAGAVAIGAAGISPYRALRLAAVSTGLFVGVVVALLGARGALASILFLAGAAVLLALWFRDIGSRNATIREQVAGAVIFALQAGLTGWFLLNLGAEGGPID